jgi:hypothetical protein
VKPPICHLCHRDFSRELDYRRSGGDLVQFADYRPLPPGYAGHPHGLEWFCSAHLDAARALASRPVDEAMAELERRFGSFAPWEPGVSREPELWLTSIGPARASVFAIVRRAAGLSPAAGKALLGIVPFRVSTGRRAELEPVRIALEAAGARVELRFP